MILNAVPTGALCRKPLIVQALMPPHDSLNKCRIAEPRGYPAASIFGVQTITLHTVFIELQHLLPPWRSPFITFHLFTGAGNWWGPIYLSGGWHPAFSRARSAVVAETSFFSYIYLKGNKVASFP